jgi:hypothetical protein
VFWLIGLDAPIIKNINIKKLGKKFLSVHLNNLCSPTKFCGEKTFFEACVKKIKNGHVNSNVGAPKFFLL